MRVLLSLTAGAALSVCAAASASAGSDKLDKFERTGEIDSCIGLSQIQSIDAISETEFLVKATGGYYLNEVSGRCRNVGRGGYRMEYTTSQSTLCRNEIIRVVDNTSGMIAGTCGLGGFERLEKKPMEEAAAE